MCHTFDGEIMIVLNRGYSEMGKDKGAFPEMGMRSMQGVGFNVRHSIGKDKACSESHRRLTIDSLYFLTIVTSPVFT